MVTKKSDFKDFEEFEDTWWALNYPTLNKELLENGQFDSLPYELWEELPD